MRTVAIVAIVVLSLAAWVFYPAAGTIVAIEDGVVLVEFQDGNVYGFLGDGYTAGTDVVCIMAYADRSTVTDDMVIWVFTPASSR